MKRSAFGWLAVVMVGMLLLPVSVSAQEEQQEGWAEVARLLAEAEALSRNWTSVDPSVAGRITELNTEAGRITELNTEIGVQQWAFLQQVLLQSGGYQKFIDLAKNIQEKVLPDARVSGFSITASAPPSLTVDFEFTDSSSGP